ncbi:MAG: hypothetical protein WAV31_05405 [Candidatus Moraniibacteriota bacterium]
MSERKPAHEAVIDMIDKIIEGVLEDLNDLHETHKGLLILIKREIISTLLEVLRRMIIPKEAVLQVADAIRDLKAKLPAMEAEMLFPEKVIRQIIPLS